MIIQHTQTLNNITKLAEKDNATYITELNNIQIYNTRKSIIYINYV